MLRFLNEEEQKQDLQRANVDLLRQVQQLESGMQDLGREHQTMQVVQQRLDERRWEDDKTVTHCRGCNKRFGVATRRVSGGGMLLFVLGRLLRCSELL